MSDALTLSEGVVAALHKDFIPNWTSKEFGTSVEQLARIVDAWSKQRSSGFRGWTEAYLRVLELEAKFWPQV
jgi:thiaminase